jgi:hypothetical protein
VRFSASFSRIFWRLLSPETMGNFWVILVCVCVCVSAMGMSTDCGLSFLIILGILLLIGLLWVDFVGSLVDGFGW